MTIAETTPAEETASTETVQTAEVSEPNAITIYQNNLNVYLQKVSEYPGSRKQLQQVMVHLALHPLQEEPKFVYSHQQELYDLGTRVDSAKYVLMYVGMENQKANLAQQSQEQPETKEETNG